jgi:hypothetical protein
MREPILLCKMNILYLKEPQEMVDGNHGAKLRI